MAEEQTFEMERKDGAVVNGKMGRGEFDIYFTDGKAQVPARAVPVFLEGGADMRLTESGQAAWDAFHQALADNLGQHPMVVGEDQPPPAAEPAAPPSSGVTNADWVASIPPIQSGIQHLEVTLPPTAEPAGEETR